MKRLLLISALILPLLGACGGAESQATPIGDAIKAAVASGKLPDLDTSDSLAGPDVDGNGVRDDIDRIIDKKDLTQPQKKAVRQFARAMQKILVLETSKVDVAVSIFDSMTQALGCAEQKFENDQEISQLKDIEKFTFNTMKRIIAYDSLNQTLRSANLRVAIGVYCDE